MVGWKIFNINPLIAVFKKQEIADDARECDHPSDPVNLAALVFTQPP
jgi:hypothetical protein